MAIDVDDILLPRVILSDALAGLLTATAIDVTAGGIERRRSRMPVAREQFTLHYKGESCAIVRDIFRSQQGPLRAFLFDDVDDNAATDVILQKVTVGGVTKCQLVQVYQSVNCYTDAVERTAVMPVYRLKAATLAVTVDDTPVSAPADYSQADGLLTFTSEISGEIKASFEFYKVVRFADEALESAWLEYDVREIGTARVISLVFPTEVAFSEATAG